MFFFVFFFLSPYGFFFRFLITDDKTWTIENLGPGELGRVGLPLA